MYNILTETGIAYDSWLSKYYQPLGIDFFVSYQNKNVNYSIEKSYHHKIYSISYEYRYLYLFGYITAAMNAKIKQSNFG